MASQQKRPENHSFANASWPKLSKAGSSLTIRGIKFTSERVNRIGIAVPLQDRYCLFAWQHAKACFGSKAMELHCSTLHTWHGFTA